MLTDDKVIPIEKYQVKPGKKVINLNDYDTGYTGEHLSKKEGEVILEKGIKSLAELQDKLYAHNQYRILIILQARDAAGKDSAVKHVMSGFNPLSVKVYSFKTPTAHELDHDYLWRHYQALPARGEIAIHNRSHYENVLVTRVHPEYILKENLPGIDSLDKINQSFWENRFQQINRFESNLHENGMIILKFFLHVSKDEQKKRFMERIDDPSKNWKFAFGDLKERSCWNQYQTAYAEALSATSQSYAPWYVVPADNKWFTRLVIASALYRHLEKLDLSYPVLDAKQKAELTRAKEMLQAE